MENFRISTFFRVFFLVICCFIAGCTDDFVSKLQNSPIQSVSANIQSQRLFEDALDKCVFIKDVKWKSKNSEGDVSAPVALSIEIDTKFIYPNDIKDKIKNMFIFLSYRVAHPSVSNSIIFQESEGHILLNNGNEYTLRINHDRFLQRVINEKKYDLSNLAGKIE